MTQPDLSRTAATFLFVLLLLGSLFLVYEREGLLAWGSALLGGLGLALMSVLHGRRSLYCLVTIYAVVGICWAGSIYYVYSSWESGEVLQIQLEDGVTFRTWVVDSGGQEIVIYECPPENQAMVEAGSLVTLQRGEDRYEADMRAVAVDFSSEELANIYALYEEKYAKQSEATDMYYLLIGPRRGSQLYVLYLTRRDA